MVVFLLSWKLMFGCCFWNVCRISGNSVLMVLLMKCSCSVLLRLVFVWCVMVIVCLVCLSVCCVLSRKVLLVGVSCELWLLCLSNVMFILFLSLWIVVLSGGWVMCSCLVVCWKLSVLVIVMNCWNWCRLIM